MSNRTPSRVRSRASELPATQGANALSHAPQPIPATRPQEPAARRRTTLSVVPALDAKRRVPFIVSIFALVIASVVAVLLINVYIANGQYTAVDLRGQERTLSQENEALRQEALYLGAPQVVAKKAADLGMVKPGAPAAINLETGKIAGTATAAEKPGSDAASKGLALKAPVKPEALVAAKAPAQTAEPVTPAVAPEAPADNWNAPKTTVSEADAPQPTDGTRPSFSKTELNGGTIPAPSLKTPGQ